LADTEQRTTRNRVKELVQLCTNKNKDAEKERQCVPVVPLRLLPM